MKKTVGLRTEILVTLSFLLMAALLLGGLLMLRLTEKRLLNERVRHLDELMQVIALLPAGEADQGDTDGFSPALQQALRRLPGTTLCDAWWLYDADLDLRASFATGQREPFGTARRQQARLTGEAEKRILFPSLLTLFWDDEVGVQLAVPLFAQSRFSGVLEAHFGLQDIRQQLLGSLRILLLYVVLYGLVLVGAGYLLIQRNVITPARTLLRATEAVGRGDLATRLPTAGPQEIAQLAGAYNRMVEALRTSRAETQQHIDQLEQTNRQLQQARDELVRSEKMAAVGQLAAGLAHELGNPLAALIGYLELLKHKITAAGEKERDIVERSLAETMRIDYLVRELLNFSRPADKNSIEAVEPVRELRACVALLGNQGNLAQMQLIDRLPPELPPVTINRQKLHQVFINLLLNAIQACAAEGTIELTAGSDDATLWLAISDNGCGIAPANLSRIFDPFYTSKEPGKGTGLGLTICHRIIEEAGGRLQVTSQPGQGSTFRVEFEVRS